ncbi:Holliday junction branch migration protein RuvA [Sulfurospirillum sp. 1612]|uniref:Holliday junction branch migration protein RuvA n=1 Tax=Sulfurospirillum sp. 1612 TaxID=3094835 RepID=UPI002F950EE6
MIIGIEGKILKKEPTFLHIKTNSGLVYKVNVSLFTSSSINTDDIFLHTTLIIREDHHTLFGFLEMAEKNIFDTVVKLNGIGPSTALAICSTLTPSAFASALMNQQIEAFTRVPGIGPKNAKRLLVELSDFSLETMDGGTINNAQSEAMMALESLGFKKERIKKVLTTCKSTETTLLIKEALKKLG